MRSGAVSIRMAALPRTRTEDSGGSPHHSHAQTLLSWRWKLIAQKYDGGGQTDQGGLARGKIQKALVVRMAEEEPRLGLSAHLRRIIKPGARDFPQHGCRHSETARDRASTRTIPGSQQGRSFWPDIERIDCSCRSRHWGRGGSQERCSGYYPFLVDLVPVVEIAGIGTVAMGYR